MLLIKHTACSRVDPVSHFGSFILRGDPYNWKRLGLLQTINEKLWQIIFNYDMISNEANAQGRLCWQYAPTKFQQLGKANSSEEWLVGVGRSRRRAHWKMGWANSKLRCRSHVLSGGSRVRASPLKMMVRATRTMIRLWQSAAMLIVKGSRKLTPLILAT